VYALSLQRLILTFKPEGVEIRALYRTKSSSGPGTKARQREASELARSGLREALDALEGGVECVGTSGFTTREDVLLATTSPDAAELAKGA
jgi:hypothetical protein